MLRASVSLSREVRRDFNSSGYAVTLDGEIPFSPDDADAVLEKVSELFHLVEEALAVEIERDHGNRSREVETSPAPKPTGNPPTPNGRSAPLPINRPAASPVATSPPGAPTAVEPATLKQQQYLQTLGRRKGVSRNDLDAVVARVLGTPKALGELSKREAGQVIDHFTKLAPEAAR